MIDYSDDDEIDCTAGVAVYDYSPVIKCAYCGVEIEGIDNNYDDQDGESVCADCYERDVEPFEIWGDEEERVIGYRTMAGDINWIG